MDEIRPQTGLIRARTATAFGFAAAVFAAIWLEIGEAQGVGSTAMLRDPAAEYDLPVLAGAISMFGVLLLTAASGALALAASLGRGPVRLMWAAAAVTGVIALDDQFMWHERVLPRMTGLPEEVWVGLIGLAGLILVLAAWRRLGSAVLSLAPAMVFLGISVLADAGPFGVRASYAVEDLNKGAGYAAWAAFWVSLARASVAATLPKH